MNKEDVKKLAEWAGGCVHDWQYLEKTPPWGMDCIKCGQEHRASQWWRGVLPEWKHMDLPDFPNDLNACFKWLVPMYLSEIPIQQAPLASLFSEWLHQLSKTPNFALALCKAIEKLNDRGGIREQIAKVLYFDKYCSPGDSDEYNERKWAESEFGKKDCFRFADSILKLNEERVKEILRQQLFVVSTPDSSYKRTAFLTKNEIEVLARQICGGEKWIKMNGL